MENSYKSREWVKTAAIIFLVVLLILTFFSNTIMNMTLAEVSTYAVQDGTISAKVRATGKVTAVGNNQVKAEGTRTIAAVKVKAGQEVNEGDILFVMGQAGSEELESAESARDTAYYAYERQKVSYPINSSGNTYNVALEDLDAANARLASATEAYTKAENEHSQELAAALDAYNTACAEYEAIAGLYNSRQTAIDVAINDAQNTYNNASNDYQYAAEAYYQANNSAATISGTITGTEGSGGEEVDTQKQIDATIYYNELASKEERKLIAGTALNAAQIALSKAQSAQNEYASDYQTKLSAKEQAEARYTAALDSSGLSTYLAAVTAAQNAVTSAQSSASTAYSNYVTAQQTYNQSVAQQNVNVEEAKNSYEKKQSKLDNLNGVGEDINVYAKVSGTVSSVSFSSGDTVTKDDIMCTIEVPDMGYTMEATVTKDQASRLKVGDVGEQSNYYWGKTVTGTINSIKADPKNPQEKRIVTFDLEGDVTSGQELTLSVGSKTATYDYIVPKSAVKSDNNGKFVLVIQSKNNALGNRYFAKRVTVEVLAEDDSYRAISGDIGNGDFVITNSSTKINSGDQVRLADSN